MISVPVGLGDRSYDILIEPGLIRRAGSLLSPYARSGRIVIVTDHNVGQAALPPLVSALAEAGMTADVITLPAGEATKSWDMLAHLSNELLAREVERKDYVVALGGGVIGDLVGLACAILKRGCNFIQVPTTLLAQVDSSVGGKTAINVPAGKNLVGAFHQPALVLIDPEVLDTLPERECRAGYAEVVKYGLINDFAFFEWCEANGPALLAGDRAHQVYAIEKSVRAKAEIVAADERETDDLRALLNLGHTFGHALEAETGFSETLLHGEAVAAGMALAFRFASSRGMVSGQDATRVSGHLERVGLPTGLKSAGVRANGATLVAHMLHDKKMSAGTLPFILPHAIGNCFVDRGVALAEVEAFLDRED
jgi:3-dehydroquinate synthase